MNRKAFFKMIGRGAVAAGTVAAGVSYVRRNPVKEDVCDDQLHICHRCGKTRTCNLPHAEQFRVHQARMKGKVNS